MRTYVNIFTTTLYLYIKSKINEDYGLVVANELRYGNRAYNSLGMEVLNYYYFHYYY